MLESIKKFLVGNPPKQDDTRIFQGGAEPEARAGLLRRLQLAKGDVWIDTAHSNSTYYFDGERWDKVTS